MKKLGIWVIAGTIALTSCNQEPEEITTESGMKYTLLDAGKDSIPPGNMLLVHFTAKDANDSTWIDSRLEEFPRPTQKADSIWEINKGGIEEVLFNMKKGDSISCKIPVEKVLGRHQQLPPGVEQGSLLTINLKIEDAMEQEAFNVYWEDLMQKMEAEAEKKAKEQLATDIDIIDKYLKNNNIYAQKSESGLRYVITEQGEGEKVQPGQSIKANYAGYVLNGGYFDTSIEQVAKENGIYQEGRSYEPFETPIGVEAVIQGWDEGFQLLNPGSKATLYIPSGLAYGPSERGPDIPANSILVFDVELLEIVMDDNENVSVNEHKHEEENEEESND